MPKIEYIYGINVIDSILTSSPQKIFSIYLEQGKSSERINNLIDKAKKSGISIQLVSKKLLTEYSNNGVHQGVVASVKPSEPMSEGELLSYLEQLKTPALLVILDGVQDPHNLGACMRSCECLGAHALIVPKDKSAMLTPVAKKVSSGAHVTLPFVVVTNLSRFIKNLQEQGIWVIGADGTAKNTIKDIDFKIPSAIILGAEGKGLRSLTKKSCDNLAKIPQSGFIQSLNVSVATGVVLYEALRQRQT